MSLAGLEPASLWERLPYRSDTGGVTPMLLEGRCRYQRERCQGMTDEERAWRKKFLQDQILDPDEPLRLDVVYTELRNPIRRFYLWPGNKFQLWLEGYAKRPVYARITRWAVGKKIQFIFLVYWATYYGLYCGNTWETETGLGFQTNKPTILPGEYGYPFINKRSRKDDYAHRGFKNTVFYHMYDEFEGPEAKEYQRLKKF